MNNPRAKLGDITEANYRRHITMRAAAMNTDERNLAYAIEWAAIVGQIMDMHGEPHDATQEDVA